MSARTRGAYKAELQAGAAPGSFGARLRKIRVAWGMTQRQLAERLNTDQQMISLWERNKTQPSRTGATLLASYLGLSVEALLSGEGFTVPEMPTTESSNSLERHLPIIETGSMVVISLASGESQPVDIKALKRLLDQKANHERRVWVVVDRLE